MRSLFVLSLLCLLHSSTGRRVQQKAELPGLDDVKKNDDLIEDEFTEDEDIIDEDPKENDFDKDKIKERCKGLPTKEDKAGCVCGSAEGPGVSKTEVETRCRSLKMTVFMVGAGPWSCRYAPPYAADESWCRPFHPFRANPKKPAPSPVGPGPEERNNDDTKDDIEDDLEEDLDLEDEEEGEVTEKPIVVTTKEPTEEKGEDLKGLCAKVCLPKIPKEDNCKFEPPFRYKGVDRTAFCNDKCEDIGGLCIDKFPAEGGEGGGGGVGGGSATPKPSPKVEERAHDETANSKEEMGDLDEDLELDEEPELDEEDLGESDDIKKEKEKEPTMTCASLVKSATPAKMVTQAQLKKWCGSDSCGSKLKMRTWAICGLADGRVSGPGYGGVVGSDGKGPFDCYINCKGEAEKISGMAEDCISDLGKWGHCSRGCGGGTQRQQLIIKKYPSGGGKHCPAPPSRRCNTHKCKDCFPADASVETPSGKKSMSELRVGDFVRSIDGTGKSIFDEVYFFGHADKSRSGDYLDFTLSGSTSSMQLSRRHFLPSCPQHGKPCNWGDHLHTYADEVLPGDFIWAADSAEKITLQKVMKTTAVVKKGLYNPYTLGGKIVVNGVVASAHSNWILDDVTPASMARYLPSMYQVLFLPGRLLYQFAGPSAADMLDVNNPQMSGDKHGHGPEFLAVCVMCGLMVVVATFNRQSSK